MKPILILQLQRMGDLILTFPLILWLNRLHPGRPVWVVGEEGFFKQLYPVSPQATFFPWEAAPRLARESYHLVINLSHREMAAEFAGSLKAEERIGPARTSAGLYIRGDWQLYRAGLTGLNRHNRFHWADLNALDVIDLPTIAATKWPLPRSLTPEKHSVGIFLGASDVSKRPSEAFWVALLDELAKRNLRPVLFGGPAEVEMGERVASGHKGRVVDTCGKLKLNEIALAGQTLQLFITPDTGPMHLAAWTGVKVLNLSMGPVSPWETGPYQPGNLVLAPRISCAGCWACDRPSLLCHQSFSPARVAFLAAGFKSVSATQLMGKSDPRGARLMVSGRRLGGLYSLLGARENARDEVGLFWHAFFGHIFGLWNEAPPLKYFDRLANGRPGLARAFARGLPRLGKALKAGPLGNKRPDKDFDLAFPPLLRPLAGYLRVFLENGDASPAARKRAIEILEVAAGVCRIG